MRVDSIHPDVEHALLFGSLIGGMSPFPVRRNVQLRVIPYYGFPASELGVEQMLCGSLYQKKMENTNLWPLNIMPVPMSGWDHG